MKNPEDYGLDFHCTMMIEQYRLMEKEFARLRDIILNKLRDLLKEGSIVVSGLEARVKTEESLVGKLELKGQKYKTLSDITDIVGARVITFYTEDVDKIASLVAKTFDVDWKNSVDKRKLLTPETFGYMSLHYICSIPKSLYSNPAMPELNEIRFEIQMRTALQHVWASMNHDTGYKSSIEVPADYLRSLTRLAGLLELADEEFHRLRKDIVDYRRKVEKIVKSGNFDDLNLDGDSFRSYLACEPFSRLVGKIASINNAEVQNISLITYLKPLLEFNFKTIGDIERMKATYGEDAYQLALIQLGGTDLDIIASSVGLHNLIVVHLAKGGFGQRGIKHFLDLVYGRLAYNDASAARLLDQVSKLPSSQASK